MSALERIENNIVRIPESGCWIWMGHTQKGYGRFNGTTAHRAIYKILIGDFPSEFEVDHKCRVRECVNPFHLEPITKKLNILRGVGFSAVNARKTHCHNGHPYTNATVRISINGWRACLLCEKENHTRAYTKFKERKACLINT